MDTQVLDVIEQIYAAGSTRGKWNDLLETIPDLAGCEAASMLVVRPQTGTMSVLSPRTDAAFIDAFFSEWWQHDPTYARTLTAPVGETVTLAHTGRERFLASPFHNEFWKGSGHGAERMRSNLLMNRDIQIGFGLIPSAQADAITARMRRVYAALLPHLIRAVETQWRIHKLELEHAAAVAGGDAGVVVVTSAGRVLLADTAAEAVLARGTPLTTRHGVLCAREARDTDTLHRLIRTCRSAGDRRGLRGGTVSLQMGSSTGGKGPVGKGPVGTGPVDTGPALTCRVMPMPAGGCGFGLDVDTNAQAAAIIVLEDAAARRTGEITRLRAQFELTEKEAIVALDCLNGGTRVQLATRLGLSDSTVRTHLTRIYEKTDTTAKAELVGLLYRSGFSG